MPRMVVSIDGVVIKEVTFTKERTTVGRRPYNDVVIDNLAVSGEHAVFLMNGDDVEVEDLGSTNGTYVNGKAIKRQPLRNGDTVELGKYKIRFLHEEPGHDYEKTMVFKPGMLPPLGKPAAPAPVVLSAAVRVMNGPAAGREVALTKVVTTIGKPGLCVASITRRAHGFDVAQVNGEHVASVNGVALDAGPVTLKMRDQIDLAGIRLEFFEQ